MSIDTDEMFIPGQAGRIQTKYLEGKKKEAPIVLILHPHPQYGGTMNNRIIYETYRVFFKNGFSVCKINFRGVGKSDGTFDNGQGELSDAAGALDWLEKKNINYNQCWVAGFSFGALICMQLLMRRPEINRFIAISPQPNVYDFSFLAPCPASGLIVCGKNDELVPQEYIEALKIRINQQKGINVKFEHINDANHFYKNKENELKKVLDEYIKKEVNFF